MDSTPMPELQSQAATAYNRILALRTALTEQLSSEKSPEPSPLVSFAEPLVEFVERLADIINAIHDHIFRTTVPLQTVRQRLSESFKQCLDVGALLLGSVEQSKKQEAGEEPNYPLSDSVARLLELQCQILAVLSELLDSDDHAAAEAMWVEHRDAIQERNMVTWEFQQSFCGDPPLAHAFDDDAPDGGELPTYDAAVSSPTHPPPPPVSDAKAPLPESSSSSLPKPGSPSSEKASSAFSSFFKTITSLPSLLRRVEPLVSALCQAATQGDVGVVSGLLSEGANTEGWNEDGRTALICAVQAGHLDVVRTLLDKGAKMTTKDSDKGIPPLFHAVEGGRLDIISFLLNRGADPNARGSFGQPFLVGIMETAPADSLGLLFKRGADPNTTGLGGKALIIHAVQKGRMETVRVLLDHGAKITARTPSGQPLLALAVNNEDVEMARFLHSRGADINSTTSTGKSLLALAVEKPNVDMVKFLLSLGADPDSRNMTTPVLGMALSKDHMPIAQLLLSYGANANASNTSGKSLLFTSVERNRPEQTRALLSYGATPVATDHSGTPIILYLLKSSHPPQQVLDTLQLLLDHNADPNAASPAWQTVTNSPLGHCIYQNRLAEARLLLRARANPNRAYHNGITPFMYAVSDGKVAAARLMAEYGANANVRDASGETVLGLAVKGGNLEMVRLLLGCGAIVFEGARSQAILARKMGMKDIVKVLDDWVSEQEKEGRGEKA